MTAAPLSPLTGFATRDFLRTTLIPPTNRTSASMPSITASETMAPITPPTAAEIPELPDEGSVLALGVADADEPVLEEGEVVFAQAPVVLPHALHHVTWSPTAILAISALKLLHGRVSSDCPKRGYGVRPLVTADPLENKKRTEISSGVG